MDGMRLLRTLRLTNFLSYGPEGTEIELQPLNVLIGSNGSGKSNLIEAIGLLKAAPADISSPIRAGGGMPEWPWKGEGSSRAIDLGIETTVSYPQGEMPLRYGFQLAGVAQGVELAHEIIEYESLKLPKEGSPHSFYRFQGDDAVLSAREPVQQSGVTVTALNEYHLSRESLDLTKSILSQRKDPDKFPELTYLVEMFSEIRLFRTCDLGQESPLRGPQKADQPASFLLEDGRNLGVVLNDLLNRPKTKKLLLGRLQRFYEGVEDITTKIYAGTVETFFHERGLADSTPSTRLSDGTLLYLRLLTILCHPSPPPLVCIEEPETGLHPAVLPMVAELLIEASERTQLIVTTHSDILVSAFSDMPEAIVVCERDDQGSHLRRLDAGQLKAWLDKYSLGELWMMGETGGNPW